MCVRYPLQVPPDPVFYLTDILLPPLLFGIGVVGCLLIIIVSSFRELRRESAIYVYLVAIATADLVSLCCAVPRFIRSVGVFPFDVSFCRQMAYAVWLQRALRPVCGHSAMWLTALTVAVRYAGLQLSSVSTSKWTRISLSRVLVFVVFLFCLLLNFTLFLDAEVVELTEHCFEPMTLWSHNVTRLGLNPVYRELHPVVVCFLGQLIPLAITFLFTLLVGCSANGCRRFTPFKVILKTPSDREEGEFQLNIYIITLSLSLLVLESPSACYGVFEAFFKDAIDKTFLNYFHLVARCLGLLRCSLGFIIIALVNYDFRKTFRRNCCCCCPGKDDEYFEPVTCCRCSRQTDDDFEDEIGCHYIRKRQSFREKTTQDEINAILKTRQPAVDNIYTDVTDSVRDQQTFLFKADDSSGVWI